MKKYRIGYTQGVYDMFHIGHLNLINHAKEYCDYLIVGANSDELVKKYKNKDTVIKEGDRVTILKNIKAVNDAVIVNTLDKITLAQEIKFDAIFIGDDWRGNPRWEKTREDLAKLGIDVVFLPHTEGVSSTMLAPEKENRVHDI